MGDLFTKKVFDFGLTLFEFVPRLQTIMTAGMKKVFLFSKMQIDW